MSEQYPSTIASVADELRQRFKKLDDKRAILKAPELKQLYAEIPKLAPEERAGFGNAVNELKKELTQMVESAEDDTEDLVPIDVTAPFDLNSLRPSLLPATQGTIHPVSSELSAVLDIFTRMGFEVVESRLIDDDYHMFESLNFPEGHPARDDYDTFMTEDNLIAPAHTSVMQNRVLRANKDKLEQGEAISAVIPGRVFRNEDLDARHEHTFTQIEGVYVDRGVTVGHLISTFKTFLETYYEQDLDVKITPFYFPFTEPSFEFSLSCPFCQQKGCQVCSHEGWIELMGCGLIHPNVLKMADIDPNEFTGFAWGFGVERLIMLKQNIEDIRHFNSANLKFLRQFK